MPEQRTGQPPTAPRVLESATRQIEKATLVPLEIEGSETGQVLAKSAFVRQAELRPGDVDAVRARLEPGVLDESLLNLLAGFENDAAAVDDLADAPVSGLREFGRALVEVRKQALSVATTDDAGQALSAAVTATRGFEVNTAHPPLGMLNLERLEMAPTGIERGELIATIPLAPLEETAVVQKEWSVRSKEFTSIVTDSLEEFSETGVTDNTELAQSTSSQTQHSNQFNVTGTVSGGIPVISGSATSSFTMQDANSESANDSRKHAKALTQKASTRSKQEHKVTISSTTVSGSEVATTRKVRNPSATDPVRIDYFSIMRKWRVRLYRHGLRLTYDVVIPEPGASLRKAHKDLAVLKAKLAPFNFLIRRSEITPDNYQTLADQLGAVVPKYPDKAPVVIVNDPIVGLDGEGGEDAVRMPVRIPDGVEVDTVTFAGRLTGVEGKGMVIWFVGSTFHLKNQGDQEYPPRVLESNSGGNFMAGATGSQSITIVFVDVVTATLEFKIQTKVTDDAKEKWRTDVWNALFNAAQTKYYAEQQDIAAKITELEDRLARVDTLTLRREENDEIMKGVIRFIAGHEYQYMPEPSTTDAFRKASTGPEYGIGFAGNKSGLSETEFADVRKHENTVRLINQAIEWENVVTFLYSYFWDAPESWDFVRQVEHPDSTRQAFLRAGSARVVLTVRKGWEKKWLQFAESRFTNPQHDPGGKYLTIAQEIAAYDDRNYPGIPPANPERTATRLQDSVYAVSNATLAPSPNPVTIRVDSTAGFVVGEQLVIDSADKRDAADNVVQESQLITAIVDATKLTVAKLKYAHDGSVTPFPVLQPGSKGALIAEWNEYTPTSGVDIAMTSDLDDVV